ncbi:hypothetical protein MHYP_G00342060 [Metynnis hypsauchen]
MKCHVKQLHPSAQAGVRLCWPVASGSSVCHARAQTALSQPLWIKLIQPGVPPRCRGSDWKRILLTPLRVPNNFRPRSNKKMQTRETADGQNEFGQKCFRMPEGQIQCQDCNVRNMDSG